MAPGNHTGCNEPYLALPAGQESSGKHDAQACPATEHPKGGKVPTTPRTKATPTSHARMLWPGSTS